MLDYTWVYPPPRPGWFQKPGAISSLGQASSPGVLTHLCGPGLVQPVCARPDPRKSWKQSPSRDQARGARVGVACWASARGPLSLAGHLPWDPLGPDWLWTVMFPHAVARPVAPRWGGAGGLPHHKRPRFP